MTKQRDLCQHSAGGRNPAGMPRLLRVLDEPEVAGTGLGMARVQFQNAETLLPRPCLVPKLLGEEVSEGQSHPGVIRIQLQRPQQFIGCVHGVTC